VQANTRSSNEGTVIADPVFIVCVNRKSSGHFVRMKCAFVSEADDVNGEVFVNQTGRNKGQHRPRCYPFDLKYP
jgi:hypothetical protein